MGRGASAGREGIFVQLVLVELFCGRLFVFELFEQQFRIPFIVFLVGERFSVIPYARTRGHGA